MDDEIFRTTLSDRKFASFYNIDEGEKKRYGVLCATFFCNLVLTGVLLSYGIIVSVRLYSGVAIYELLLAPGIFCVSRSLADPWFRDAAESWKNGITSRTLVFFGVFICCMGVATSTVAGPQALHAVSFGLLGGIGSSLVLSQIDFVITDLFQVNINRVRLLGQYGQALGQCTMPYLAMVLFHFYGHSMGYLLLSCSVLQLLPVILFLKTATIQQPKSVLPNQRSYVRAYSLFEDDTSVASGLNDVQLVDMTKKSWKSPSDENLSEQTEEFEEDPDVEEYENINETTENKIKNLYGVDILPQILEESENSDTDEENESSDSHTSGTVKMRDKKKVNDDIKRLSVISNKLDEIIIKSELPEPSEKIQKNNSKISDGVPNLSKMGDGKSEYSIVRRTSNSMDWLNDTSHLEYSRNTLPDFKRCCPFYSCYRTKRKFRNAFDYLKETFFRPLKLGLKTIHFYPALLLKVCSIFVPCCLSSLVALLANDVKPILSIAELGFVLSVHGIAWLTFLILFPWMTAIPISKYKYIAAFGCFASAFGSFVIMDSNVFEFISLGSAITGVGYGAILASCEETMRNCIGLRKWSKLRGTLDSLAGFIITFLVMWMSYLLTTENGLSPCFGVLIGLLSLSGLIWVVIPLIVIIRKHHNVQHLWPEA